MCTLEPSESGKEPKIPWVTGCLRERRGPIIPVPMGEDRAAVMASERLAEAGFFVPAIRPPTVPEGGARLRISLSAAHDEPMVDALVAAIHGIKSHP